MLSVSIGAWADPTTFGTGNSTYEVEADGSYTITVKNASDLSAFIYGTWPWISATKINLKLDGITMQSLCEVDQLYNLTQGTSVTTIDVTDLSTTDLDYLKDNWNSVPYNFKQNFDNLVVPSSYASDFVATGKNVFAASGGTLTAYIANVNNVNWSDVRGSCATLKLPGTISTALDLGNVTGFTTVNLTEATISANVSLNEDVVTKVHVASDDVKTYIKKKDGSTAFDDSKIEVPFNPVQTVTGGSIQTQIEAYLAGYTSNSVADFTSLTVTGTLTSADVTYLSSFTGLATLDLTGTTFGTGVTKASVQAAVPNTTTVLYPTAYTVSGCDVTIDMGKALGDDLATLLAAAKADVVAGGNSNICTLTVTGEVTDNDLIALGGTNMTGATRIDLSGATLASGASIGSIKLPSSLEQLVLPEDQTVDVGLASKLAAATNLWYAYSPSSDSQKPAASSTASFDETKNLIADYVWVNKAGGLAQAFTNEELLRNSY